MSDTSARDPSRDSRDTARETARDNAISVAAISSERIEPDDNAWTRRLVLFLRIMAVISIVKGLYHWAQVTGFIGGEEEAFENQSMAWQTATIYFAVIELVAAVGLWLATPWGAVRYCRAMARSMSHSSMLTMVHTAIRAPLGSVHGRRSRIGE